MLDPIVNDAEYAKLNPTLQAEYKRDAASGEYRLDVAKKGGLELADTGGLLSALSKERADREKHERAAREMSSKLEGVNLDELKATASKYQELVKKGGSVDPEEVRRGLAAEFDRQRQTLVADYEKSIGKMKSDSDGLRQQLDAVLLDQSAMTAILAIDKGAEPLLLMPEIRRRTRVAERDGRRFVEVLDDAGQVRIKSDKGSVVPLAISDLVEELKNDPRYGRAFSAPEGGSGAGNSGGGSAPKGNPFDRASQAFSLTAQAALMKSNPAEAARLRAAAGPLTPRNPLAEAKPKA